MKDEESKVYTAEDVNEELVDKFYDACYLADKIEREDKAAKIANGVGIGLTATAVAFNVIAKMHNNDPLLIAACATYGASVVAYLTGLGTSLASLSHQKKLDVKFSEIVTDHDLRKILEQGGCDIEFELGGEDETEQPEEIEEPKDEIDDVFPGWDR